MAVVVVIVPSHRLGPRNHNDQCHEPGPVRAEIINPQHDLKDQPKPGSRPRNQDSLSEVYRGHEVTVNLLRKIELQIAVNEDFVEPTVNAILEAGRSGPDGKIGDGKIFILPLDDCIRIRTGERGPEAI